MNNVRISLFAPNGRMGKAIAAAATETDGFEIVQDGGDVLVDFSAPDALQASLDEAVDAGTPILVGTTGLGSEADKQIAEAAKSVA
jgi:4-hydroxy-tetrahydrodipicolinate reductase